MSQRYDCDAITVEDGETKGHGAGFDSRRLHVIAETSVSGYVSFVPNSNETAQILPKEPERLSRVDIDEISAQLADLMRTKHGDVLAPAIGGRDVVARLKQSVGAAMGRLACRPVEFSGFTYVVRLVGPGSQPWKIGRSNDPCARLSKMQRMMPFEMRVVRLIHGGCYERTLLKKYASSRSHGEWFSGNELRSLEFGASDRHICATCMSEDDLQ